MRLGTWIAIGAVAALVLTLAKQQRWYYDLMLRAFAKDQVPPHVTTPEGKRSLQVASSVASEVGLPVGWVLEMAPKVPPDGLSAAAQRVVDKVKSMGPPPDTTEQTLAWYKKQAMSAAWGTP